MARDRISDRGKGSAAESATKNDDSASTCAFKTSLDLRGALGLVAAGVASFIAVRLLQGDTWVVPDSAKALQNPVVATPAILATAKSVYSDSCARCHGDTGKGDGPDAKAYRPPPASLADPQRMGAITDGELYWKITQGHRPMPSFQKQLSDDQRWQLVNFLRTLAPASP